MSGIHHMLVSSVVKRFETIAYIASAQDNFGSSRSTIPTCRAGDLLYGVQINSGSNGDTVSPFPTGWQEVGKAGTDGVEILSAVKVAVGNEGGTNVDFMASAGSAAFFWHVYRCNARISSITLTQNVYSYGSGKRSDQTKTPSTATAPMIVLGSYGVDGNEAYNAGTFKVNGENADSWASGHSDRATVPNLSYNGDVSQKQSVLILPDGGSNVTFTSTDNGTYNAMDSAILEIS